LAERFLGGEGWNLATFGGLHVNAKFGESTFSEKLKQEATYVVEHPIDILWTTVTYLLHASTVNMDRTSCLSVPHLPAFV
jgi:hypothetical protein